jgi:peptidyl-prolyl cis-trans isomerase B (cyclophilin B)
MYCRKETTEGTPMAKNVKADVDKAQEELDLGKKTYTVELTTNKGLRVEFFADKAPGHVKNFLALSKIGFYDGLIFHRIIKGFMIQGGCPLGTGTGDGGYKIRAEFNDTPHKPGVLSMARAQDPNSAGTQFFICLEYHKHLDRNYTAFGKVADDESLKTVKAIGDVATGANDKPREPVKIEKAVVKETAT